MGLLNRLFSRDSGSERSKNCPSGIPEPHIFVAGIPACWETSGENAWKQTLASSIGQPSMQGTEAGLSLHFGLASLTRNGQPFDLDNLCEPVLKVLVRYKGWFGGRGPNIQWLRATMCLSTHVGCGIDINGDANRPRLPNDAPFFEGAYKGRVPKNGSCDELIQWAKEGVRLAGLRPADCDHKVFLEFSDSRTNLGEIADGAIKHYLDCLFPVYGGECRSPADHRIKELIATKPNYASTRPQVTVRFWRARPA